MDVHVEMYMDGLEHGSGRRHGAKGGRIPDICHFVRPLVGSPFTSSLSGLSSALEVSEESHPATPVLREASR